MKFLWLCLVLLVFAGCAPREEPMCKVDADCPLPMEYAIRSSCPFSTVCDAGECRVVCFDAYHDPNPQVSKSYPVMCEQDRDCSCDYFVTSDSFDCRCIQNKCASVVK